MVQILAVGSPKGGVGKSTEAVHIAVIATSVFNRRVLLVDADDNHSASDWAGDIDGLDVATATGADATHLASLRRSRHYDLVVVDLPGAREGAFRTMLAGAGGKPVPQLLLIPSRPRVIDLRPTVRVIRDEIAPLRLPYLLALTMVRTSGLHLAQQRAEQLRADRVPVAQTIIRDYTVYDEAHELDRTVVGYGGPHHPYARVAEQEQRDLTAEVLDHLDRK